MRKPSNRLRAIWAMGERQREKRLAARRKPSLIRIWDGNYQYVGTVSDQIESQWTWKYNDTGSASLEIPLHNPIARWVLGYWQRDTKNVHVTMDKDGARWCGRMKTYTVKKDNAGRKFIEIDFLHDYENIKFLFGWPNPFLPNQLQFPRTFVMMGPSVWVIKSILMFNIWRLSANLWSFPDDPMDWKQWVRPFYMKTWPIVIKPDKKFGDDSSPWTVISSRMKNMHELIVDKLNDAQLMITCERYLEGDPEPWPGASKYISHGTLIIDVVDKSGWWDEHGTATHGTILHGLVRTVQHVRDTVDTEYQLAPAPGEIAEYHKPNWLSTAPTAPYVVYREGRLTGINSSEFSHSPATAVQVLTGGHSAYGVNEAMSAAIQLAGNALGTLVVLPTAGTIADTLLKPLYSDTILAWNRWRSHSRARNLGKHHYFEHFADGADTAYTINSVVALRKGFYQTREKNTYKLDLRDGAPWFIGDRGQGHFFLGDRIGAAIEGLPEGRIVVEQVTEITYSETRDSRSWKVACGDLRKNQSPLENILVKVKDVTTAAHDLGVQ